MEVFSLPLPGIYSAAAASKHSLTHKHSTLTLSSRGVLMRPCALLSG
jgi:hypothetical protein